MPAPDAKPEARYQSLFNQMTTQAEMARTSARKILTLLFQRYQPQSMLDVGCGVGTWLSMAREMGVGEIRGVDGPWLDPSKLLVDPSLVSTIDLEKPVNLGRKFDLAICLETAEHVSATAADTLVETLVRHAPAVLFSAAIPLQRGPGHVNEQWPGYWAEKFSKHRYMPLDFLRFPIWYDTEVLWWYRQNVMLYVDVDWCRTSQPKLMREAEIQNLRLMPSALVLPDLFHTIASKLIELEEALLRGGEFQLEVDEHRLVHLIRLGDIAKQDAQTHVEITPPRPRGRS